MQITGKAVKPRYGERIAKLPRHFKSGFKFGAFFTGADHFLKLGADRKAVTSCIVADGFSLSGKPKSGDALFDGGHPVVGSKGRLSHVVSRSIRSFGV